MWSKLREWRHSPCLMTPLTAFLLFLMSILSLVALICQLPGVFIGLIIAPIAKRSNWFIEFLYPLGLAKWGHLTLLRWGSSTKCEVKLSDISGSSHGGKSSDVVLHSRCIEQRTEVVKGRVYIHPLPQLLDNIGYLIVCVPTESSKSAIVGILVDCGDAESAAEQIAFIKDIHYGHIPGRIEIHALLCTHKHHDHTAGNKGLLQHPQISLTLKQIYGGAVENVPYCNVYVSDGSFITLPISGSNDMNSLISIECIAAPTHTRGSIVYALRNKARGDLYDEEDPNVPFDQVITSSEGVFCYLFTGDTMFSGGGGVPFEADIEFSSDRNVTKKKSSSPFKPSAGYLSLERCFSEILRRAINNWDIIPSSDGKTSGSQQILIFPGHEYTLDLLQRQFQPEALYNSNSTWSRHHPAEFFELASQYFIAGHRRNLPRSTRLLAAPSSMKRELKINPYYRSLKRRGEHLLTAISVWYKYGKRSDDLSTILDAETEYLTMPLSISSDEEIMYSSNTDIKTKSSYTSWNINHEDLNKSIFATVYSADLKEIIDGLKDGTMDQYMAAFQLSKLSDKLEKPTVQRRPVPNTFSSEKKMYLGLLAMAVLGSKPCGLTKNDSEKMNLPSPAISSDYLLISKSKLISSLFRLGLLPKCSTINDVMNHDLVQMIDLLWEEARSDFEDLRFGTESDDLEVRQMKNNDDLIELGALKLTLYSVPYNKPSWFSRFCMPCGVDKKMMMRYKQSEIKASLMERKKRSGGELVRHEIGKCPMCASVVGCPTHIEESVDSNTMNVQMIESDSMNNLRPISPSQTHSEGIELKATQYWKD